MPIAKMRSFCSLFSPAIFIATSAFSTPAMAQEAGTSSIITTAFETLQDGLSLILPDDLARKGLRVRLGAGFGTLPDYVGSDDYRVKMMPIIDIRYGNRLRLDLNKLSYSIYKKNGWEFGPLLKYKSGRSESRNPALEGLGNIGSTLQAGAFAKYKGKHKLLQIEFRQALSSERGSSVRILLGHGLYNRGKFKLAGGLGGKWMSRQGMQTDFGITAEQAAGSVTDLDRFDAGAGISEVSAHLFARYDITDTYRFLALASYCRLTSDAANSPLVADFGNANQFKVGAGFTIDF